MLQSQSIQQFLILIGCLILILSCSTQESLSDRSDDNESGDRIEESANPAETSDDMLSLSDMDSRYRVLYDSRSRLSDFYSSLAHDMPESYLQSGNTSSDDVDIYAGYRIQLISTRNVTEADTLQRDYEAWADTTFLPKAPDSYIFFRQPYYRVRIGNFYDRDEAVSLSRFIKNRYPEAWVVHDRIAPEEVLPDTVQFQLISDTH